MMAFVGSPDKQSIELLQKGEPLLPAEPWKSMPHVPAHGRDAGHACRPAAPHVAHRSCLTSAYDSA
jgi:hypothetical protein